MEAAKGDDAMLAGVVHGGGGDGEMGVRPGAHAAVEERKSGPGMLSSAYKVMCKEVGGSAILRGVSARSRRWCMGVKGGLCCGLWL